MLFRSVREVGRDGRGGFGEEGAEFDGDERVDLRSEVCGGARVSRRALLRRKEGDELTLSDVVVVCVRRRQLRASK